MNVTRRKRDNKRKRTRRTQPGAPTPRPEPLHNFWRSVLVILAAILLGVAAYAWFSPPTKVEFAPQATGAEAIQKVEVRSETMTVLLIGLSMLLVLIAANGRKLKSFEFAGGKVSVEEAAVEAEDTAEAEAKKRGLDDEQARKAARNARAKVYTHAIEEDIDALDISEIATQAVQEVASQRP